MWAQKLTTAPPDPPELEVACAALEAALAVPEPVGAQERADARRPAGDAAVAPVGQPQPTT